jgi:hypothetical protein
MVKRWEIAGQFRLFLIFFRESARYTQQKLPIHSPVVYGKIFLCKIGNLGENQGIKKMIQALASSFITISDLKVSVGSVTPKPTSRPFFPTAITDLLFVPIVSTCRVENSRENQL